MKLLYITNGITGAGGLERVLSVKASYLAENLGYEVYILTLNERGKDLFYEFSPKIICRSLEVGGSLPLYVKEMRRAVREIRPDIISVCDDGLKGFTIPLWIGGDSKVIYERHASVLFNGNKLVVHVMRHLACLFDRFIVLTHYNLSEWKTQNLQVIPNPLPFDSRGNAALLEQKRIICVGSISYNKGYDLLVKAWSVIKASYPDWQIDVFGKGDSDHLQCECIIYHEPDPNIAQQYLNSSILALPSRSEGFGMVLIEAMSCGVPCVAFDCPCGPRDIIRDGEDGFLVENGNVELFAERLSSLIENEELRKRMGQNARGNVQRYKIEIIAKQWDRLFKSLCHNRE